MVGSVAVRTAILASVCMPDPNRVRRYNFFDTSPSDERQLVIILPVADVPMIPAIASLAGLRDELNKETIKIGGFNPPAVPCSPDGGRTHYLVLNFGNCTPERTKMLKERVKRLPGVDDAMCRSYTLKGLLEDFGYSSDLFFGKMPEAA